MLMYFPEDTFKYEPLLYLYVVSVSSDSASFVRTEMARWMVREKQQPPLQSSPLSNGAIGTMLDGMFGLTTFICLKYERAF